MLIVYFVYNFNDFFSWFSQAIVPALAKQEIRNNIKNKRCTINKLNKQLHETISDYQESVSKTRLSPQ